MGQDSVTVKDAWHLYCEIVLQQASEKSRKTEEGRWKNYISKPFSSQLICEIKAIDIARFRSSLERRGAKSPQTVYHILSLLRRILRCAKKYDLYDGSIPVFEMPHFDNKIIRFLTKQEAECLLLHLRGMSELWHDIVLLDLQTGLRAKELLTLTKANVRFESRYLCILESKNGKVRSIPLNDIAYDILKKYKPTDNGYFFQNANEECFKQPSIIFRKAVEQAELNVGISDRRMKIVFHSLRHTFASWLVQSGVSLMVVGKLLGHSTQTMTERYAHLCPDQLVAAINHSALQLPYFSMKQEEGSIDRLAPSDLPDLARNSRHKLTSFCGNLNIGTKEFDFG